jgi:hypothetical protein
MRNIYLLLLILLGLTAQSQPIEKELNQLYLQYSEYCNTVVDDTVTLTGIIKGRVVPVYEGTCITSYETVYDSKDTTWEKLTCKKYKMETTIIMHFTATQLLQLIRHAESNEFLEKKI